MVLAESDTSAVRAHDRFNLAATSTLSALTCAAHINEPMNAILATTMVAYLAADSVWLMLRPEIAGGQAGGGAQTLLGHHAAAFLISFHALTWAPHTHYTCWMTVVEINTLILMLEKQLPVGAPTTALVHKAFVGSWVILRMMWFPYLAFQLSFIDTYPSTAVHVACAASLLALTVLQCIWTWNFCVPPERQIPLR